MRHQHSYATLDPRLYHRQMPSPLENPRAGHFNPLVAHRLGWLEDDELMSRWVEILAGQYVPDSFDPLAMAYAGHQFGHWAGQLGDGRGLLMTQVLDNQGTLTDLHLKGIGLTPYSRMGDGRAVLRSTIREYLCGHAMNQLGIPSSDALGFVVSDSPVRRERIETGAALMRVADCHVRLGHIEWVASFAPELLAEFSSYLLDTYYPDCRNSEYPLFAMITEIVERTARLIAGWQLAGFAHGVMNTDNLSITGATIDYGPFGFMEAFNPTWINNHSDVTGRYSYQNQPAIGYWNLQVVLPHLLRLQHGTNSSLKLSRMQLDAALARYEPVFISHYQDGVCAKLGMANPSTPLRVGIVSLAYELLELMQCHRMDYSNSFRSLLAVLDATNHSHEQQLLQQLTQQLPEEGKRAWHDWQRHYRQQITQYITEQTSSITEVCATLARHNPVYVLRNAMAQYAIEQAELGNMAEVDRLYRLLSNPHQVQIIATAADSQSPDPDDTAVPISCSS